MNNEFVQLATAATKTWMGKNYLCDFKRRLEHQTPENQVNILIMGGSVTRGAHTNGCYCRHDSCKMSTDLLSCIKKYGERNSSDSCCSWPRQLMRWIKQKTNATVNFIDYGIGGTSSLTALQLYVDSLPLGNLTTLDLVLLDYSVNDACTMWGGTDTVKYHAVEHSIEWLIRRLLSLYSHLQPLIVLLNGMPSVFYGGYQYTTVYEEMARYYSIPLWSYDSVAQSQAIMGKKYTSLLRWQDNCLECGAGHPSWPVHLFTADLYAAIMEEEFSRCPSSWTNSSSEARQRPPVLPPPITGYEGIHFCEFNAAPFLQISAEEVHHGHPHTGKYSGGWRVEEDRPNKWGWIDEFAHDSHHHGGSIAPAHRSLVFNLRDNGHLTNTSSSNNDTSSADILVRVAFLKTYNNTGQFDIYLCGAFLQSIDTCWGDPNIRRSTTELSFIPVRRGVPSECKHDPSPTLEFRHVWMDHTSSNTTRDYGCERRFQKVKVIDVTVCTASII